MTIHFVPRVGNLSRRRQKGGRFAPCEASQGSKLTLVDSLLAAFSLFVGSFLNSVNQEASIFGSILTRLEHSGTDLQESKFLRVDIAVPFVAVPEHDVVRRRRIFHLIARIARSAFWVRNETLTANLSWT